ncbi:MULTISPECIES: ABC transporter ATP-binding protein [Microbacterium]|uniref:ABC transporter ATP-binding protein n=1 Tax=Microbacterium TaxID=33882 RepID=UPI0004BB0458|nr:MULTISPECIES: ABC transporter ATP-binding protein [Microbacterium]
MTIDRTTTATQERVGASLSVRDLRIHYGNVEAVKGISFDILPGEFLTLLGPSGCGKSTTLRCIAGLEPASAGTITIDDTVVAGPGKHVQPEKRGINMVFQSYAVWPHMTVEKNVGYGLKGLQKDEIKTRVDEVLDLIGLGKFAKRYGTELSGGQQQRVALARAIVTRPKVLLFDEPLSNLDAGLREQMRFEILALQRAVGITAVYVTHDQTEAMSMSDRVVLLNDGLVEQSDAPREIYSRPRTEFAANFVGHANILPGRLDGARERLTVPGIATPVLAAETAANDVHESASAVFRAESLLAGSAAESAENVWPAKVERVSYLGRHLDVLYSVGDSKVRGELPSATPIVVGDTVTIGIRASDVHFVPHTEA